MKVMHVLKSSIYSGAENVVISIMKGLADEFDFLYVATEGEIRSKLEQEKVSFVLLERFDRKHLARAILEYQPDIVHAHDFSASVICASVSGQFRLISHLHYDPPWSRAWNIKTVIYMLSTSRISKILTVSEGAYNNMVFAKSLRKKTITVSNPINTEQILMMGNQYTCVDKFDLLFVARFVEQKNPQKFIEIVNILQEKNDNIKCAMLGDGDLWKSCKELIEQYQLQKNVELLGFQENPYAYMKASKMLCMTSRWEGYGLVAIEANVLGVPVISTKTGGITDLFGERAEELCDKNQEFADKIGKVLTDKIEYQSWKERAVERGGRILPIEDYMNQIIELYKKENR